MFEFISNNTALFANLVTVASSIIATGFWFYNRLINNIKHLMRSEIEDLKMDLKSEFKSDISDLKIEVKSDISDLKREVKYIRDDVIDIDRRLCRIEGALSNRDHCMLKDSNIKAK